MWKKTCSKDFVTLYSHASVPLCQDTISGSHVSEREVHAWKETGAEDVLELDSIPCQIGTICMCVCVYMNIQQYQYVYACESI